MYIRLENPEPSEPRLKNLRAWASITNPELESEYEPEPIDLTSSRAWGSLYFREPEPELSLIY